MKTIIEEYARKGESYDVMQALRLLTSAYMDECGLSLGYRTLVYYAAEQWQEKLAWLDLPLSEMARKEACICLMPYILDTFDPDYHGHYDITGMEDEELVSCCSAAIETKEFDEPTLEVICWGINDYLIHSDDIISIDIETVAKDGTLLKGVVVEQDCSETNVRMTLPYQDIYGVKYELVRNANEILEEMYDSYNRIISSRELAEQLYEEYKTKLNQSDRNSRYGNHSLFKSVFAPLLNHTALLSPEGILKEAFGMEFFDAYRDEYPSWYTNRQE